MIELFTTLCHLYEIPLTTDYYVGAIGLQLIGLIAAGCVAYVRWEFRNESADVDPVATQLRVERTWLDWFVHLT